MVETIGVQGRVPYHLGFRDFSTFGKLPEAHALNRLSHECNNDHSARDVFFLRVLVELSPYHASWVPPLRTAPAFKSGA
jgi:hypothetical protein